MRAIKLRTMAEKLLKYRRYFGAADTGADFDGRRPAALSCSLTRPPQAASARLRRGRCLALSHCSCPALRR